MILKVYDLWVMIEPAHDVPGQWVAHCLSLDVVTQGNSAKHAFQMVVEAVTMTLADDLCHDVDPLARRAPEEFWTELDELRKKGLRKDVENGLIDAEPGTTAGRST